MILLSKITNDVYIDLDVVQAIFIVSGEATLLLPGDKNIELDKGETTVLKDVLSKQNEPVQVSNVKRQLQEAHDLINSRTVSKEEAVLGKDVPRAWRKKIDGMK